ncbi:MAG: hypothetical protein HY884_03900 [Deltaproteobacteria bacterium]|nr:hypothetical protein [Deltaproteobacteria bacterium]
MNRWLCGRCGQSVFGWWASCHRCPECGGNYTATATDLKYKVGSSPVAAQGLDEPFLFHLPLYVETGNGCKDMPRHVFTGGGSPDILSDLKV